MRFEMLLKKLDPQLKAIARKVSRNDCYFNVEDLYQEEVVHLWEEYVCGTIFDKTESYILQGCYFFLKNFIRTHHHKIDQCCTSTDWTKESASDIDEIKDEGHFVESLETGGLKEKVKELLTPREWAVLLGLAEGLTRRQIGGQLGVSHVMVLKIEKHLREKCAYMRKEFYA